MPLCAGAAGEFLDLPTASGAIKGLTALPQHWPGQCVNHLPLSGLVRRDTAINRVTTRRFKTAAEL